MSNSISLNVDSLFCRCVDPSMKENCRGDLAVLMRAIVDGSLSLCLPNDYWLMMLVVNVIAMDMFWREKRS